MAFGVARARAESCQEFKQIRYPSLLMSHIPLNSILEFCCDAVRCLREYRGFWFSTVSVQYCEHSLRIFVCIFGAGREESRKVNQGKARIMSGLQVDRFVWFKELKFDLKLVLKSTIRKRYFIDISYDYEYKVNGNK